METKIGMKIIHFHVLPRKYIFALNVSTNTIFYNLMLLTGM